MLSPLAGDTLQAGLVDGRATSLMVALGDVDTVDILRVFAILSGEGPTHVSLLT